MDVGIRDASLIQAGFRRVPQGLEYLGLQALEVNFPRGGSVISPLSGKAIQLDREEGCSEYRAELNQCGIRISAFLCAQNFGLDPVQPEIDWIVAAVRAADALGIPAVRIDSAMKGQDQVPLEQRVATFAGAARRALDATGGSRVRLGIENHGRQGNDPAWMDGVLERVNSPRLGLTLDLGNWYWFGHPLQRLYEIYRKYAPHTVHTHVKSIRYPEELREEQREVGYRYGEFSAPLDEGDIDFARAVGILRQGGYDGDLVIEDESLGKFPEETRPDVLRRDVEHLRRAIAAATGDR
jgi:sugar phosphate isomerase/epimerase